MQLLCEESGQEDSIVSDLLFGRIPMKIWISYVGLRCLFEEHVHVI